MTLNPRRRVWCRDRAGHSRSPPALSGPRHASPLQAQDSGHEQKQGWKSASNPQTCRCQIGRATERHGRLVRIRPSWCTLLLVYSCEELVVPSILPVILMSLVYMLLSHRLPLSPPKKKSKLARNFPSKYRKCWTGRGEVKLVKTSLLSP